MYPDFKELLSILNEHQAKYLVVGAYALSIHAQPRATKDFSEPGSFFRIGHPPVGIDILTKIDGVDFDAAWETRVEGVIDVVSGLKTNFISRDHFIATKLASGRPQDMADVAAVREADKERALGEAASNLGASGENGPE